MSKKKFRLSLATLPEDQEVMRLSFRQHIQGAHVMGDPLVHRACGDAMDYGRLFAYCFRRFGYPNVGWDDYKELTCYLLTTPHPDMVLGVVPHVGDSSTLHFTFLVTQEADRLIQQYGRRHLTSWSQRAMDWQEQQGLPDWMPQWVALCQQHAPCVMTDEGAKQLGPGTTWRDTVPWMAMVKNPRTSSNDLSNRAAAFREALFEAYRGIEPSPGFDRRPPDPVSWSNDDPLKSFALAALEALGDLRTPVGVRDSEIDAYGRAEGARRTVKPAAAAGYPSGDLGNQAPVEFAQLHGLVLQLGNGNAKRGLKKVLDTATPKSALP